VSAATAPARQPNAKAAQGTFLKPRLPRVLPAESEIGSQPRQQLHNVEKTAHAKQ